MLKHSYFEGIPLLFDFSKDMKVDMENGIVTISREEIYRNGQVEQLSFLVEYADGKVLDIRSLENDSVVIEGEGDVIFPKESFSNMDEYMSSFGSDWNIQSEVLGIDTNLPWDTRNLIPILMTLVYLKYTEKISRIKYTL